MGRDPATQAALCCLKAMLSRCQRKDVERSSPVDARIAVPSFRTKYTFDELGWPRVSNARGTNSYPLGTMSVYLVHLSVLNIYYTVKWELSQQLIYHT